MANLGCSRFGAPVRHPGGRLLRSAADAPTTFTAKSARASRRRCGSRTSIGSIRLDASPRSFGSSVAGFLAGSSLLIKPGQKLIYGLSARQAAAFLAACKNSLWHLRMQTSVPVSVPGRTGFSLSRVDRLLRKRFTSLSYAPLKPAGAVRLIAKGSSGRRRTFSHRYCSSAVSESISSNCAFSPANSSRASLTSAASRLRF